MNHAFGRPDADVSVNNAIATAWVFIDDDVDPNPAAELDEGTSSASAMATAIATGDLNKAWTISDRSSPSASVNSASASAVSHDRFRRVSPPGIARVGELDEDNSPSAVGRATATGTGNIAKAWTLGERNWSTALVNTANANAAAEGGFFDDEVFEAQADTAPPRVVSDAEAIAEAKGNLNKAWTVGNRTTASVNSADANAEAGFFDIDFLEAQADPGDIPEFIPEIVDATATATGNLNFAKAWTLGNRSTASVNTADARAGAGRFGAELFDAAAVPAPIRVAFDADASAQGSLNKAWTLNGGTARVNTADAEAGFFGDDVFEDRAIPEIFDAAPGATRVVFEADASAQGSLNKAWTLNGGTASVNTANAEAGPGRPSGPALFDAAAAAEDIVVGAMATATGNLNNAWFLGNGGAPVDDALALAIASPEASVNSASATARGFVENASAEARSEGSLNKAWMIFGGSGGAFVNRTIADPTSGFPSEDIAIGNLNKALVILGDQATATAGNGNVNLALAYADGMADATDGDFQIDIQPPLFGP